MRHPTAPNGAPDWITDAIGELKPLVTTAEAMDVLRLSERTLQRLLAAGRLHAVRRETSGSSRLLIPRASIEKYLRALEGDGEARR